MRIINCIKDIVKLVIAFIAKEFMTNREIYLVGERSGEATDNGYHFFKYVRENHNSEEFYYVIEKDSKDLKNIASLGNIIYYDSLKHYIYYLKAVKLICAHVGSCTPKSSVCWKLEEENIINKNKMFIQHGIIKDNITSLKYDNTIIKTFVCGAKREYEFVKDNFGYPKDDVKYLGLCRFDNLVDYKLKNQILLMPTWRQWFGMTGNSEYSNENFKKAEYFKIYNSLINNNRLEKVLEDNEINLVFYPHYEMQRYVTLFNTVSKRIIIAKKYEYNVQDLLKESRLLITDYSSVFFDFGFMRKPVIYYQFDKERYYKEHYNEGYFEYDVDGFGPVVTKEEELIDEIIKCIEDNNEEYIKREEEFFPLHDNDNCKRHYLEAIGG